MTKSGLLDVIAQVMSSLVGRVSYFGLQVYLARSLGPQSFGIFALGLTAFTLMSGIAPFGMPQAVIRFELAGRRALTSTPMAIAMIVGVVGSLLLVGCAEAIGIAFKEPEAAAVIAAMAPSVPLLCVFGVLCAALRSGGRNVASAVVDAMFFVLYLSLTVFLFEIAQRRSATTAALGYDFALGSISLVALFLCWRVPGRIVTFNMRHLVSFGFVTMIIHSVSMLNLQIDRLLIGIYAGGREVGIYQAATQIAMAAIVIRVAVLRVFEARVPKSKGATTTELTREFIASMRILMHISAPGLICIALSGTIWTRILFGSAYVSAAIPLAILVLGQLAQSFTGPSITALHMIGQERTAMKITLGAFAINALGNILLLPRFGLIGSATAAALASIVLGLVSYYGLRTNGRLASVAHALVDIMVGAGFAAIPPAGAVWFGYSSITAMVVAALLSYGAYALAIIFLKRVDDEAFDFAWTIVSRTVGSIRRKRANSLPRRA